MEKHMNDKKIDNAPLAEEMADLKRDMRSAQITAWLESNTQTLTAGVIVLILVLAGGGLWIEHNKSLRSSAATVYQQALVEQDGSKKKILMDQVVSEFGGTSYATLAEMQLARLDGENAESHLQAVIDASASMEEWKWQARLDIAEIRLDAGDKAGARAQLEAPVGKEYEQLRQYLLAQASDDASAAKAHLQKALDAPSLDNDLKAKIEEMLSGTGADAKAS
jgi:predicted negative regulator of RcsB-dependent stress response